MTSRIVRWTPADGAPIDVARRLRADHPGERIDVSDLELVHALVDAGATVVRRSYLMALGPLPDAVAPGRFDGTVGAMRTEPSRYAGALLRAFPPEHPDYDPAIPDEHGAEQALASYFSGAVIGPYLEVASAEAVSVEGQVVGGLVINRMPPDESSPGGPWVTEVFVEPGAQGRGVGRALFARAIAELRSVGESSLRLAVQVDNPAQHLYRSLGFDVTSSWSRIEL